MTFVCVLGQLIKKFNWGPSQPTGDDQHCMYIVGGYLGYQWADFHCGFEMTFLCEHDVNGGNEAWRRRREMKKVRILQTPFLPKGFRIFFEQIKLQVLLERRTKKFEFH